MMLYVRGNLLQSPAQVLVNTVNTVGVMGRGIALDFKRLFPEMYQQYRELCEQGQLKIGELWLYRSPNKWVLNFPTKKHWRYPSHVEYIEAGLKKFVSSYEEMGIHSIAFPALGCGNGQLEFESQVRPLFEQYLSKLPIEVFVYPGRESVFVEHMKPAAMKAWLRSEPQDLPFTEVWDDLIGVMGEKEDFLTIARHSPFKARISQDPPGIQVIAGKQRYHIHYDELMSFWQQLRTYGFSMRHIAPGLDRQLSYLISIFNQLDYVTPVHVADNYSNLQSGAVTGLQVLPSAFIRESGSAPQFTQLSLFQSGEPAWSL
jgi:O-acetyl-ADP-ribose deacetylase (regulator of RNase III)